MVRIARRPAETAVVTMPRMRVRLVTARVELALEVIQTEGEDQEGLDIIQQLAMLVVAVVVLPLLPTA